MDDIKKTAAGLGFPCIIPRTRTVKTGLKPTDVYAALRQRSRYSFLLESAIVGEKIARYSFLGCSPVKLIKLKHATLSINGKESKVEGNPMNFFRDAIKRYNVAKDGRLPKFFGGLLGYFSYDIVRYFEDIGRGTPDHLGHCDAEFMLVKDLIVFDHWKDEVMLISNMMIEDKDDIEKGAEDAEKQLDELENTLKNAVPLDIEFCEKKLDVRSNFEKEEFEEAVRKAKEYIYAGDIFQVVLSQRFVLEVEHDPFDVYLMLKEINPSPYMYFLEFDRLKIAGSSPEILVRTDGDRVIVRPIAGTRPRGKDAVEDEALAREMANDPKERAEHVMLVDLGRNDVGKVSKFGSVVVDEFMGLERYSHVQHLVSNVVGTLEDGMDSFDAFEASFPAGTVSGAPKVRAMQIIEELEPTRRGIYAGAIGYFSFDSDMDFAITIRTIVFQDGRAYVQAGAGIVADSDPEKEYYETVNKGKGMIRAVEKAGGKR